MAKQHSTVIAEGKERDGHTYHHGHDGEGTSDPVEVEEGEIVIEQVVIGLVRQQFYERLDAAIGELTRHHGEESWERQGFGRRLDFGGKGNGHAADDKSSYAGSHGDVPIGKVHEEKTSDVAECGKKGTTPEGGTSGIADACKSDASNGGKNTVIDDIVGEF